MTEGAKVTKRTDRDLLETIHGEVSTFMVLAWDTELPEMARSFLENLKWKVEQQLDGQRWWEEEGDDGG